MSFSPQCSKPDSDCSLAKEKLPADSECSEAPSTSNDRAVDDHNQSLKESDSDVFQFEPCAKRSRKERGRMLHLAVAGCSHGEMDAIYDHLLEIQRNRHIKFDLLLCCGDFQANRNYGDLAYFNAPLRHLKLKTFYKYYSGAKLAPILTIFIGGNHESVAFLAELPHGGWVAPNIYYMGYSSVVRFAGLRIAGISGIYKVQDYSKGHFERPPFPNHSNVSAYHVRSIDIFQLKQLQDEQNRLDIFMSHDWPCGITEYGDKEFLLRIKPHFADDIRRNQLGNPATMDLLQELKPSYWFSAHMHVKFEALVEHQNSFPSSDSVTTTTTSDNVSTPLQTKFIALDKPVFSKYPSQPLLDRRRKFVECIDIPISDDAEMDLSYDPQWLAILKNTDHLIEMTDRIVYMPSKTSVSNERHDFRPSGQEINNISERFSNDLHIPLDFKQTAPPETFQNHESNQKAPGSFYYRNPQTTQFCEKLGIKNLNDIFAQAAHSENFLAVPYYINCLTLECKKQTEYIASLSREVEKNPDEIDIGDATDEFGDNDFVIDELAPGDKISTEK